MRQYNKREELPAELTFEDLALQGRTGQARTLSGTGRKKKYEYRRGIITPLGDMEESLWLSLIQDLIVHSGEEPLQKNLIRWLLSTHICQTKQDAERYALELHSMRMFDQPRWVDYVPFNARYRPDVLSDHARKNQANTP